MSYQQDSQVLQGRHTLEQAGMDRGEPVAADVSAQTHASKRKIAQGQPPTGVRGITGNTMCMKDIYCVSVNPPAQDKRLAVQS